jgi:hypothetical protein
MSDVHQIIHQARGHVMQGVATLQTPGVPPELSESAQPLSQVAGLLEQLQSGAQLNAAASYPVVLSTLQRALHALQWSNHQHPLREAAIDHVAGALGLVFSVSTAPAQLSGVASPAGAPAVVAPREAIPPAVVPPAVVAPAPVPAVASPVPPATPATPAPAHLAQPGSPATLRQTERSKPSSRRDPKLPLVAAAVKAAGKEPAPVRSSQADVDQPPRVPASRAPATEGAGHLRLDALLGANSASNFYRGFDGDDVVDHGGVFVATYNLPSLGQRIALRVSLPDGRDFTTRGVVKWRRLPAPDGSHPQDIPPGFGLSMEEVSDDARALIARYVNNREPLFHDDT